jgi:hypothetical protein
MLGELAWLVLGRFAGDPHADISIVTTLTTITSARRLW